MGLIRSWRRGGSAKKIARLLPRYLAASYGASEFYTPQQIKAALARCRIAEDAWNIAFAAFLPLEAFIEESHAGDLETYEGLRAFFISHVPSGRGMYAFDNVMSESVRQLTSLPQ